MYIKRMKTTTSHYIIDAKLQKNRIFYVPQS